LIIDSHVHILDRGHWPNEWFDWVALDWAARKPGREPSAVRTKIEEGLIDPDGTRMVTAMDGAGVDVAVVLPMDWGPAFAERMSMAKVNEHALALARDHPGRFVPFVGIDPRRQGAADLVETFLRDRGAKGLKLYPPAGFDPYEPDALPLYEVCQDMGVPVLFHTGETLPKLSLRRADPILLTDVHAAFPRLVTLVGHAGAKLWWNEALATAAASIHSHLELSAWIWNDTSEGEQLAFIRRLDEARNRIGIERLVFGSDHMSGRRVRGDTFLSKVVGWYRKLPEQASSIGIKFTPDEMHHLLAGNAARLLGLNPNPDASHA
jgi:predicted TIM-barrel fold metal-dependent hydrolase